MQTIYYYKLRLDIKFESFNSHSTFRLLVYYVERAGRLLKYCTVGSWRMLVPSRLAQKQIQSSPRATKFSCIFCFSNGNRNGTQLLLVVVCFCFVLCPV